MKQISNYTHLDDFFDDYEPENKLLPNPYYDYPFLKIENFLDATTLNLIVDKTKESTEYEKAKTKTLFLNSVVMQEINKDIRKTNVYSLDERLKSIYNESFLKHQNVIEDFFKVSLTLSTEVQVLEYTAGAFYIRHADDSNDVLDKDGNLVGFLPVATQRVITSVLFATTYDDNGSGEYTFNGGELVFNFLYDDNSNIIKIKPKSGEMYLFFSNPYFSHEVLKVKDGYRLTLVQWHNIVK